MALENLHRTLAGPLQRVCYAVTVRRSERAVRYQKCIASAHVSLYTARTALRSCGRSWPCHAYRSSSASASRLLALVSDGVLPRCPRFILIVQFRTCKSTPALGISACSAHLLQPSRLLRLSRIPLQLT